MRRGCSYCFAALTFLLLLPALGFAGTTHQYLSSLGLAVVSVYRDVPDDCVDPQSENVVEDDGTSEASLTHNSGYSLISCMAPENYLSFLTDISVYFSASSAGTSEVVFIVYQGPAEGGFPQGEALWRSEPFFPIAGDWNDITLVDVPLFDDVPLAGGVWCTGIEFQDDFQSEKVGYDMTASAHHSWYGFVGVGGGWINTDTLGDGNIMSQYTAGWCPGLTTTTVPTSSTTTTTGMPGCSVGSSMMSPMPDGAVNLATAAANGDDIYVVSGYRAFFGWTDQMYRYDALNDSWNTTTSGGAPLPGIPTARTEACNTGMIPETGEFCVIGGITGADRTNAVECYNTLTNIWNEGYPPVPAPNDYSGYYCAANDGVIYVSGGNREIPDLTFDQQYMYWFDTSNPGGGWTQGPDYGYGAAKGAGGIVQTDDIGNGGSTYYLQVGGNVPNTTLNQIPEHWITQGQALPSNVVYPAHATPYGRQMVLAGGGSFPGTPYYETNNNIWVFDVLQNSWEESGVTMEYSRAGAASACTESGELYVFGGFKFDPGSGLTDWDSTELIELCGPCELETGEECIEDADSYYDVYSECDLPEDDDFYLVGADGQVWEMEWYHSTTNGARAHLDPDTPPGKYHLVIKHPESRLQNSTPVQIGNCSAGQNDDGQIDLSEDFEGYPVGSQPGDPWVIRFENGAAASIVALEMKSTPSGKVLEIVDPDIQGSGQIMIRFEELTQGAYSFKWAGTLLNGEGMDFALFDNSTGSMIEIASVQLSQSDIRMSIDLDSKVCKADIIGSSWHDFEWVVDLDSGQSTLFIDENVTACQKLQNLPVGSAGIVGFGTIVFNDSVGGVVQIDNVHIKNTILDDSDDDDDDFESDDDKDPSDDDNEDITFFDSAEEDDGSQACGC